MNNNMIFKGKLILRKDNQWVIWHNKDFDLCATDGGDIPVHPQNYGWLRFWAESGKTMHYVIQDEFALLKPEGPDTHEYTQD